MTNSRLTDPEVLEWRYPVRIDAHAIRRGSGGAGKWHGGNGATRRVRFLEPMTAAILAGHRRIPPYGMAGGAPGDARAQLGGARRRLAHGPVVRRRDRDGRGRRVRDRDAGRRRVRHRAMKATTPPRDLVGYGAQPPHADWPGGARIAVQFVLNYEEGARELGAPRRRRPPRPSCPRSSAPQPFAGARHMSMESLYEYGSRAGVWRLLRLFRERQLPLTVFAVAHGAGAQPRGRARLRRGRPRDRLATAGAGSTTTACPRPRSASTSRARSRAIREVTGARAARLVHGPHEREHAPPRGRARRLPLRRRLLRRRPAVLGRWSRASRS